MIPGRLYISKFCSFADKLKLLMVSSPDWCMVISYSRQKPLCVYLKQEQLMASDVLAALQRKSAAHTLTKKDQSLCEWMTYPVHLEKFFSLFFAKAKSMAGARQNI